MVVIVLCCILCEFIQCNSSVLVKDLRLEDKDLWSKDV